MSGQRTATRRVRSVFRVLAAVIPLGATPLGAACSTQTTQVPQPPPPPLHPPIQGAFTTGGGAGPSEACGDGDVCVESSPVDTDIEVDSAGPVRAPAPAPRP
jgi:hypothetical protein